MILSDMTYLPRTIEPIITRASSLFKVVLLTGLRQVGKSTCLIKLANGQRTVVSLDNSTVIDDAINSTAEFFQHYQMPILIDEIQRVPKLFQQIKDEIDKRKNGGLVWATGSQRFELMKGVTESLAGRMIAFELLPLSIYEREGKGLEQKPYFPSVTGNNVLPVKNFEETWQIIWQGAWPRVIDLDSEMRAWFFDGLMQSYLERDIRTEAGIAKYIEFNRFLRAIASRTGQELRIGTLANEVGVSQNTIKSWLSVAVASGIVYLLPPYYANINKQLTKSPKIYFTDTGLAAYLCGIKSAEALMQYKDAGAFFETFVVMEIVKSWLHNGKRPDIFFYRDSKTGAEVDLLIRDNNVIYPVEVKSSMAPTKQAIKHFDALKSLPETIGRGAVICMTPNSYGVAENVSAHSIWAI